MKKIFLIFTLALAMFSCENVEPETKTYDEEQYFVNEKFKIVATNGVGDVYQKYNQPVQNKKWLIQRLNDTTYCGEITSYQSDGFYITDELWYNKSVGDTLYFEFIGRWRFFRIGEDYINPDLEKNELDKYSKKFVD